MRLRVSGLDQIVRLQVSGLIVRCEGLIVRCIKIAAMQVSGPPEHSRHDSQVDLPRPHGPGWWHHRPTPTLGVRGRPKVRY